MNNLKYWTKDKCGNEKLVKIEQSTCKRKFIIGEEFSGNHGW